MLLKSLLSFILVAASNGITVSAAAAAACNPDNCARAVSGTAFASTRSRSADCSSFMRTTVTPATVTVTATAVTTSSTATSSTALSLTTTTTVVSTTTTSVATVTVQSTSSTIVFGKRDITGPAKLDQRQATSAPTGIPAYASPCSGAVRYSSACSCFGITATTITASTPTKTVTITQTSTAVSTILTTVLSVNTVLTSTTVTAYASTTTTAVTTVTQSSCSGPPSTPTCASVNPPSEYGTAYTLQYVGSQTLNPSNPGNDAGSNAPPLTYTYPSTMSVCDVAYDCASKSGYASPDEYFSFNVYYSSPSQTWICTSYFDPNRDASYYNVNTPGVCQSYGYST